MEVPRRSVCYRSRDPISNLTVRVTLREVSTGASNGRSASPVLSRAAAQQNEDDQQAGQDASLLAALTGSDSQETSCVFRWQKKVFSKREARVLGDVHNCHSAAQRRHHEDIVRRRAEGTLTTGNLFCYVDIDDFQGDTLEPATTTEQPPSFLAEAMHAVRQRRGDQRNQGRNKHGPPVRQSSANEGRPQRPLAPPFQVMYLMADLTPPGDDDGSPLVPSLDEHVLCTIRADAHGVVQMTPDFSEPGKFYRLETFRSQVYEYTVEHASAAPSADDLRREAALLHEVYERQAEALANRVGFDFATAPPRGTRRVHVLGEVILARDFDHGDLFVKLLWDLPTGWLLQGEGETALVTQLCRASSRTEGAYFAFPFEFCATWTAEGKQKYPPSFPRLLLQVNSLDYWDRHRVEGYGQLPLPPQAGSETYDIATWKVVGNDHYGNMRRFFLGGAPELDDVTYAGIPHGHDGPILSRLGFRTEAAGTVRVKLNLIQQRPAKRPAPPGATNAAAVGDSEELPVSLATISETTSGILAAFRRAHNRLQRAQARKTVVAL